MLLLLQATPRLTETTSGLVDAMRPKRPRRANRRPTLGVTSTYALVLARTRLDTLASHDGKTRILDENGPELLP